MSNITKTKQLQLQYQGFVNTPYLWHGATSLGLNQLKLPTINTSAFTEASIPKNMLLGKRVERFVVNELKQHPNVSILAENIQIQKDKITLGEIDCILKFQEEIIHLEIIYKFYLYDPNHGDSEIEHWIGPNRNDSLMNKISKLKDKQFPLLYNSNTKAFLDSLFVTSEEICQKVYFKAQLFIPFNTSVQFNELNEGCIQGFYLHHSKLIQFQDCKFHIPEKSNWLVDIQVNNDWLNYEYFAEAITSYTLEKRAPLCWIKFPNGITKKFFVTWWE